jgi:hypothetical protein
MPIPVPNLDDRTWDDLTTEGRTLAPVCAKDWTNYNPSDPGVTLVELFAHLSDILLYRVNRLSDQQMIGFLRLLNGHNWGPGPDRAADIRSSLGSLRRIHRAVTAEDWEHLALNLNQVLPESPIARVQCVPARNLATGKEDASAIDAPGHVSLIIVTKSAEPPSTDLLKQIRSHLEPARLLATRLHVVAPPYVDIQIRLTVAPKPDAAAESVRDAAVKALLDYFDPLHGGPDGQGWPFGRDIFVSDMYSILYRVPGVLYIARTVSGTPPHPVAELATAHTQRLLKNKFHEVEGIDLRPGELPRISRSSIEITLMEARHAG